MIKGKSALSGRALGYVTKSGRSLVCQGLFVLLALGVALFSLSCGQDGLMRPDGEVNIPPLSPRDFLAVDFPTNNGSSWTYVAMDTGHEFTSRVEGTRDIGGFTHRQMTIRELRFQQPPNFNLMPVDHLSANALYFRFNSDDYFGVAFPISATYFEKTPQAYLEAAFDALIPGLENSVLHEKHFPYRLIWDFPLKLGKEWIVFEKTTDPEIRVLRRVVSINESVSVPAGAYNAYLIEEEIEGVEGTGRVESDTEEPEFIPTARYWVVRNVGVVKYEYTEFFGVEQPVLRSFQLRDVYLPTANTR